MNRYWKDLYSKAVAVFFAAVLLTGCNAGRRIKDGVLLGDIDVGGMHEDEAAELIRNRAAALDKEAENAALDEKTWEIKPEKAGKKVNIQGTLEALLNAEKGGRIELAVDRVKPDITAGQLSKGISVIAGYTTPLLNSGESRVNNIDLAAQSIDYRILQPGEEFSFNKAVGRRTSAKGYEEAPIIIRTKGGPKKGKGIGGGICQLSTTIYNAVEECGLEITERHIHSKNVGYVPKGEDATVSYGSADLRFRNNRAHPIMLRVYLSSGSVTAKILENRNG